MKNIKSNLKDSGFLQRKVCKCLIKIKNPYIFEENLFIGRVIKKYKNCHSSQCKIGFSIYRHIDDYKEYLIYEDKYPNHTRNVFTN